MLRRHFRHSTAMQLLLSAVLSALLLFLASAVHAQTGVTGTWVTYNFGGVPNLIDLQASGSAVTGTINRNNEVSPIYDGSVNGNTVTFKVDVGAAPARTVTYTGGLNGDQMSFTRSAQVRAPAGDGAGIFGSRGPMEFSATRDANRLRAFARPLLGDWRLNRQRSTYNPGPGPVSEAISVVAREDGSLVITLVGIGDTGSPGLSVQVLKPDGRSYPIHNANTLAASMGEGTATPLTRSLVAVSDRSFQMVTRSGGAVTIDRKLTLSPDGNTMIVAETNLGPDGQPIGTNTVVYERVLGGRPSTD